MKSSTYAPGHDLVGRYRIIELVGVGHTAEVYLADDLSLHRTVVVKVLLPNLAAHEDVRRAFRDHIVRAATLSHPHLARVYDGGQESGSIFMITEYLTGGSLEDVLSSGRHLSVDDTARLGRDVAGALAYLHTNGFVHASLSPSKLLFDGEGRVRVSDVALAGLHSLHREQLSLDDVRYISPEQALGQRAEPKSDIYALALILFESATGESPFETISPDAILRSRAYAALPVRPELGTLDMLLAQAAVPDPLLRLDADQFANRLGAVASDSAPLVIAPSDGEVPLLAQFAPPEPRTGIGFRPPSPEQIVGRSLSAGLSAQFPTPQLARREYEGVSRRDVDPRARRDAYERPPRRRRLAFALAAVLLIVVASGAGAAWKLGLLTQKYTVPSLEQLSVAQASSLFKSDGFTLSVTRHVNSSTVPANEIVSQSPSPGVSAKSGLVINVTVSDGPVMVTLPTKLIGEDCVSATAQLLKLKLGAQCPSSASIASATTPVGRVAAVIYKGATNPTSVPAGSAVILALSSGRSAAPPGATTVTTTTTVAGEGLRPVPNVIGMGQSQVNTSMHKAGLYYSTRGPGAGTSAWTTVVSSRPVPGTMVKWHSTIFLNVK